MKITLVAGSDYARWPSGWSAGLRWVTKHINEALQWSAS